MQNLEQKFQAQFSNVVSDAQKQLLQTQLETFYANHTEEEALAELLTLAHQGNSTGVVSGTPAGDFLDWCQERKFVGFSFLDIVVVNDGLRKVPRGMPVWKNITLGKPFAF